MSTGNQTPGLAEAAVQLATITTLLFFSTPVSVLGIYLLVLLVTAIATTSPVIGAVSAFLGFWALQSIILEASRRVFLTSMSKYILTLPDPAEPR